MWSPLKPLPSLRALRPIPPLRPTAAARQFQTLLAEHHPWIDRLVHKYGLPRAALLRMLSSPGDLEYEIASLITELAERRARQLFADDAAPPTSDDLWDRAVRGIHARLVRQKEAAEAAEKQRQYEETDRLLARIRAGEDVL